MFSASRLAKVLIVPAILGGALLGVQGVLAVPPVATFEVTPLTGECGTFTFTSHSNDIDDEITLLEWDFDYDGVTFEPSGVTGSSVTRDFSEPATHVVALRATDAAGEQTVSLPQAVPVVNAGSPTAAFSATPDPAQRNQLVTFDATGSSDTGGGSIVKYEWDLDDNGSFETNTGTTPQATKSYPTSGFHRVRLKVTDNCGAPATTIGGVDVDNSPPNPVLTVTPNPAAIGAEVTFSAAGSSDPGGSIVKYEWDLDGNGSFETNTAGVNHAEKTFGAATSIVVGLKVTDNDNDSRTAFAPLRVNAKPTANFFAAPNPALIGEQVSFDAGDSSDPDGSISKYEWDLDGNGSYETSGVTPSATKAYGTARTYQVKLRVTDSDGATNERTRDVVVQASRPNAELEFSPANPLPGQAVTLISRSTPSASPGAPQLTDIQWDFDYSLLADFTPDAVGPTATTSFATPGTKTVAVRVTETGGGFAIKSIPIVVNAAPLAAFTASPVKPVEGQAVTFVSTAVDPDGPLAAQEWDLDSDGQYDDAQGAVVSTTKLKKGNRTIGLRVTDAKGATAATSQIVAVKAKPLKGPVNVRRSIGFARREWGVKLVALIVKVPAKTTVKVACKGRGCPRGTLVKRSGKKAAALRFSKLRGSVRAGAKITLTSLRPGHITAFDTYLIRGHMKAPLLREQCKWSPTGKPRRCP